MSNLRSFVSSASACVVLASIALAASTNYIYGDENNNVLISTSANDYMIGYGGSDLFIANTGADKIIANGDKTLDTIHSGDGSGDDTIIMGPEDVIVSADFDDTVIVVDDYGKTVFAGSYYAYTKYLRKQKQPKGG